VNPETPDDDDQESPRIRAVFDRLSARVDPPVEDDWESAINNLSERPADHGRPQPPRYRVHPAAETFPTLAAEELDALADDIAEHGLREPIWLYRDPEHGEVLLDGRNRLAACEKLGIEPETRLYEGASPLEFVLSQNLHRRHLSVGERAAIAERMKPLFEREAKERKRQAGGDKRPLTVKKRQAVTAGQDRAGSKPADADRHDRTAAGQAAKAVHVSPSTVEKFARVKKADPDLAQKVAAGEVPLGRAERDVRERAQRHGGDPAAPVAREFQPVDLHSPIAIICAGPAWSGQLPMNVPMPAIAGQPADGAMAVVVDPRRFNKVQAYLRKALALHPSVTVRPKPTRAPPAADATADPEDAGTAPTPPAEPTPAERAAAADAYRRARDGG